MKAKRYIFIFLSCLIGLLTVSTGITWANDSAVIFMEPQVPVGTGFTYQGHLKDGEGSAEGVYDFQFQLYDDEDVGNLLGTVAKDDVTVSEGLFAVQLDFGDVFDGNGRWLAIAVRLGAEAGAYTPLTPRQLLSAAPYALYARKADSVAWVDVQNPPAGLADGDNDTTYTAGFGLNLDSGTFEVMTDTMQARVTGTCAAGSMVTMVNADGTVVCDPDNDTTYNAGNQLNLVGSTFNLVEGEGSGLNADLLDGQQGDEFVTEAEFESTDFRNMVSNASFELFDNTEPDYWNLVEAGSSNLISETVPGYDGEYAVRLTDTTSVGFCLQQEVYPDGMLPDNLRGSLLTLSVWARQIDNTRPVGTIALSDGFAESVALLENITDWHRTIITHQVAISSTMLLVELCPVESAPDTGAYDFDAVMLTVGPFEPPFDPGFQNSFWELDGNAPDSPAILGTTNDQEVILQANGNEAFHIDTDGHIIFGATYGTTYWMYILAGTDNGIYVDGNNIGLYGQGGDKGVSGYAEGSSGSGVYGQGGDYGVQGYNSGDSIGVYGHSSSSSGVYGYSNSGSGVKGESYSDEGVYGISTTSIGVKGNGSTYNFYASGDGTDYGPFTGAHDVKLADDFPVEIQPGMIVVVTGETQIRRTDDEDISFSSILPTVDLCNKPFDNRVLGVIIAEQTLDDDHWYTPGEEERFGIVNALGEGRVWISNANGEIHAGDYITTSQIPGYGQLQDDDLLHSYTLGKAIEDVDWNSVTETIEFDGQTYKMYPIAVVYTSG
jgi:hypothetical protein